MHVAIFGAFGDFRSLIENGGSRGDTEIVRLEQHQFKCLEFPESFIAEQAKPGIFATLTLRTSSLHSCIHK
jgi:hypothetical protein